LLSITTNNFKQYKMSLLDDVSIVVTPNGYKAGELYAVVPEPTEGAEEGANMDFSSGTSPWALNSNWSLGGVGVIADGTSNSTIWQSAVVEDNKQYIVTYTLTDFLQGSINVDLSGGNGITRTVADTYTEVITAGTSPTTRLSFEGSGNFKVTLSNVIVKEYTAADMDVTRATAATRVDEDGLVNYAEIIGSELLSQPVDLVTDFAVNSNGVIVDADTFTTTGYTLDGIRKQNFLTVGKTYKLTIEGDTTSSGFTIGSLGGSGNEYGSGFGTFYFTALHSGVWIRQTTAGTTNITSFSIKEVYRDNVPRIDYTGGGCPHILSEPARTNLIPYSEDLTNAFYQLTGIGTVTESTTLSPDGTSYGYTITPTSITTNHYFNYQYGQLTVVIGDEVTYSIFVKPNGYNFIQLASSSGFAARYQNFELTGNGVIGTGDVNGKTIEKIGDWYRCSVTETSVGVNPRFLLSPSETALATRNPVYSGNATDGVLGWGAQVEVGSYPTSYIPNFGTSAGVTRAQDIFTRDGIGSLINSEEGVLFVEIAALADGGENRRISLSDGSNDNRVVIYFNTSNNLSVLVRVDNNTSFSDTHGTDIKEYLKVGLKWKQDDFALWVDGVEIDTGTSGSTFTANTLNMFSFADGNGSSLPLSGKVKQLQVYKTALDDDELELLTGAISYGSFGELAEADGYTII
jgi:hypothetical protein